MIFYDIESADAFLDNVYYMNEAGNASAMNASINKFNKSIDKFESYMKFPKYSDKYINKQSNEVDKIKKKFDKKKNTYRVAFPHNEMNIEYKDILLVEPDVVYDISNPPKSRKELTDLGDKLRGKQINSKPMTDIEFTMKLANPYDSEFYKDFEKSLYDWIDYVNTALDKAKEYREEGLDKVAVFRDRSKELDKWAKEFNNKDSIRIFGQNVDVNQYSSYLKDIVYLWCITIKCQQSMYLDIMNKCIYVVNYFTGSMVRDMGTYLAR